MAVPGRRNPPGVTKLHSPGEIMETRSQHETVGGMAGTDGGKVTFR
jgi:hypothetical protein